jgi:CO/xanthine dehydrogenase Mo-binding subunit
MDGPAPAIINAVEDATGVEFDAIPLMPEDIFEVLHRESVEVAVPSGTRGNR